MRNFIWSISSRGDSALPAMIWFHGFLGSASDWEPFLPEFPEHRHILIDLPGHGNSAFPEPMDHEELLSQLHSTLVTYDLKEPVLIGYSMGARVGFWLDHLFPGFASTLIGLSGAPGLPTIEERQARLTSDIQLMEKWRRDGSESFLHYWYALPLFKTMAARGDLVQSLVEHRKGNNPDWLENALRSLGNGALPSLWPAMEMGKTPLLVGTGEQDSKYVSIQREIAERRPETKTFTIAEASHAFHLEKPVETVSAIKQFLRSRIEGE